MELTNCKHWFLAYARQFYTPNEEDQRNIKLKEDHSFRVLDNADAICKAHGFPPAMAHLTRLAALFHDVGRFEQYKRFHTFNDNISLDHARLGWRVLKENRVLDFLEPEDRRLVSIAVLLHNKKTLPASLRHKYLKCVRAVRDADKLDIIPVVIEYLVSEKKDPTITLGLQDQPDYFSSRVLEQVLSRSLVNYQDMVYVNDFKLLMLSWVYGLNFAYSFALLDQNNYVQILLDMLPDSSDLDALKKILIQFVHEQCGLQRVV